jgi:DNA sulfur modification protein DndC
MIQQGYDELMPYFRFRQWLLDIRNNPDFRCQYRRSGKSGPGPFNLKARRLILETIEKLQIETGQPILSAHQRARILELWELDSTSETYAMIE